MPGDVVVLKERHTFIYTGGDKPIAHATLGSDQLANHPGDVFASRQRLKPVDMPVYRLKDVSPSLPEKAAAIAKGFANDADHPKPPEAQTPYSSDRLNAMLPSASSDPDVFIATEASNEWTQASAFRAVRAALRSDDSSAALSQNKGTTCDAFVSTSIQAAVVKQALEDGTLSDKAKEDIQSIEGGGHHKPGETQKYPDEEKKERYDRISLDTSQEIMRLMPQALQVNAKTTRIGILSDRLGAVDSGFEKVGYANPHAGGLQVLPQGHPDLHKPMQNKELD